MALPRSKPWSQIPHDPNLGTDTKQCLDYMLAQINQLLGQGNVPPSSSVASFGSNIIDPRTSQIISAGGRPGSLITPITYVAAATSITFYWDGTNASGQLTIYRDDGSIFGPTLVGSPYAITGLAAATRYFFYPYWDDVNHVVRFHSIPNVSVGNPPVAFPAYNIVAQHQQIMKGHITLAALSGNTGIVTGSGGGSGGGGGGGGSGCVMAGTGIQTVGGLSFERETKPETQWIRLTAEDGRSLDCTFDHPLFVSDRGKTIAVDVQMGDLVLMDNGERRVKELLRFHRADSKWKISMKDGHLFYANGFLSHNLKP